MPSNTPSTDSFPRPHRAPAPLERDALEPDGAIPPDVDSQPSSSRTRARERRYQHAIDGWLASRLRSAARRRRS